MFKNRISIFTRRLTTVGDAEPLNRLSLAVIILLDLFVVSILFGGLEDHTRQLTSPDEYMPYPARHIFIDQTWSRADRINKLQSLVLADRKRYSYRYDSLFEKSKLKQMHPLCRDFFEKTKALAGDEALQSLFVKREQKNNERSKLTSAQDKTKKAYDTQLLETMADPSSDTRTPAITQRSKNLTARIEILTADIEGLEGQINAHSGVQELWALISPDNRIRQQAVEDFRRYERAYKFKELGWQLLFLLPIFGLFYFWGIKSVQKEHRVQALISGHMLVVTAIPILFKIIEVVIDLIPKYFFKNLFKVLKSLNLIAIWHYLVIFGSIGLGLLLIFIIQKKVFNREKVMRKRLAKGACTHCSIKLPPGAAICPFCGAKQMEPCGACHQPTPAAGTYCIHCGAQSQAE